MRSIPEASCTRAIFTGFLSNFDIFDIVLLELKVWCIGLNSDWNVRNVLYIFLMKLIEKWDALLMVEYGRNWPPSAGMEAEKTSGAEVEVSGGFLTTLYSDLLLPAAA